jgi:hypothetical protein
MRIVYQLSMLLAGLGPEIARNPNAFFFGCLILLPAALWCIAIVGWLVMGDIEFPTGLGLIFVLGLMVAIAMRPPAGASWLSPVIYFGMILLGIMLPIFRKAITSRQNHLIECDRVDKKMLAFRNHPDSLLARFELGKELYERGYVGYAEMLVQPILADQKRGFMEDEKRKVRMWAGYADQKKPVPCLKCGYRGDLQNMICPRCQANYVTDHVRGSFTSLQTVQKVLVAWMIGGILLGVIPALVNISPIAGIVGIPILLVLAGYTGYRTYIAPKSA